MHSAGGRRGRNGGDAGKDGARPTSRAERVMRVEAAWSSMGSVRTDRRFPEKKFLVPSCYVARAQIRGKVAHHRAKISLRIHACAAIFLDFRSLNFDGRFFAVGSKDACFSHMNWASFCCL